jgi:hypothetical protein
LSETEFRVGDRVRRTGSDFRGVLRGHDYTVSGFPHGGVMSLEGFENRRFLRECFELVSSEKAKRPETGFAKFQKRIEGNDG